jgi:valyl-tRNA synthetase
LPATGAWEDALIIAHWPEAEPEDAGEARSITDFNLVQEIIRVIRNLRAEKNVNPGQRVPAIFACGEAPARLLAAETNTIVSLARLDAEKVSILIPGENPLPRPEGHVALVAGPVEIYLPLAGLVDTTEELHRLEKDLAEVNSQIQRLQGLLAGSFTEKAPPAVVQKERDRLAAFQETAEKLTNQLQALG